MKKTNYDIYTYIYIYQYPMRMSVLLLYTLNCPPNILQLTSYISCGLGPGVWWRAGGMACTSHHIRIQYPQVSRSIISHTVSPSPFPPHICHAYFLIPVSSFLPCPIPIHTRAYICVSTYNHTGGLWWR